MPAELVEGIAAHVYFVAIDETFLAKLVVVGMDWPCFLLKLHCCFHRYDYVPVEVEELNWLAE